MTSVRKLVDRDFVYYFISSIFSVVVIISNLISTKMVKLPFFYDFSIPAGLITYPITFFISDLISEIYGSRRAKIMVYQAFAMSLLAYCIIKIALTLPNPSFENQHYFEQVLGLNGVILFASLTAYIISQTLDIHLYTLIRKWTGERHLWLRTNGSTLIAQLLDTTIVCTLHLKMGAGFPMNEVFSIMLFAYLYKGSFSFILTPFFYFCVFAFKKRFANSASMAV